METILLTNDAQIQQSYIFPYIKQYLRSTSKVLIIPIIFDGTDDYDAIEWEERYTHSTIYREALTDPFAYYQIHDITFLNYFRYEGIQLNNYDIVLMIGNHTNYIESVISNLDLYDQLQSYSGLLIACDKVVDVLTTPIYDCLSEVSVISNFAPTYQTVQKVLTMINVENRKVVGLEKDSALLVTSYDIQPIGDPILLTEDNINQIYDLMDNGDYVDDYFDEY